MKDYPSKFREGYKIGSVYGTFPGAIWNGGRAVFGTAYKGDIDRVIKMYNSRGVPVRFTWTNTLLEEKHNLDTYCNMVMKLADNGKNQVLVNAPSLEEYIRKEYPGYDIISSTTKRILDLEGIKEELQKDYHLVVLDYDLNHDEDVLKELEPVAGKIEILVNEICAPHCPKRAQHYKAESISQLEFDLTTPFQCPHQNAKRGFNESMKRPAFISNEEIGSYIDRGYVNFKIVGRGLSQEFLMDSYAYFLAKEEHREFIRNKMTQVLADVTRTPVRR
jgi:collagenase-like PrtC family protease